LLLLGADLNARDASPVVRVDDAVSSKSQSLELARIVQLAITTAHISMRYLRATGKNATRARLFSESFQIQL
jgi:hypothetical protein